MEKLLICMLQLRYGQELDPKIMRMWLNCFTDLTKEWMPEGTVIFIMIWIKICLLGSFNVIIIKHGQVFWSWGSTIIVMNEFWIRLERVTIWLFQGIIAFRWMSLTRIPIIICIFIGYTLFQLNWFLRMMFMRIQQ